MRKNRPLLLKSLLILGTCFALASPWMILLEVREKAANETFSTFMDALLRADFPHAYGFCGSEFKTVTGQDEFVKLEESVRDQMGQLISYNRESTFVEGNVHDGWTAVIKAKLQYSKGARRFVYQLHYEGGRWTVSGYRQL